MACKLKLRLDYLESFLFNLFRPYLTRENKTEGRGGFTGTPKICIWGLELANKASLEFIIVSVSPHFTSDFSNSFLLSNQAVCLSILLATVFMSVVPVIEFRLNILQAM